MQKIKKMFVNILCLPVLSSKHRRKMRNFLMDFSMLDGLKLICYSAREKIQPNTVLLCELNICHGEILPGYARYLIELGYNVHILVHRSIDAEKPFLNHQNLKIFANDNFFLRYFLQLKKVKKYKKIILTSSYSYSDFKPFAEVLPTLKKLPVVIVAHDTNDLTSKFEQTLLKDKKIIMLGDFENTVFVNSHYFGDFPIHNKNKKTVFITIGGIQAFRKNHNMLINSVRELSKVTNDFSVVVIGSGEIDDLPDDIKNFINVKGRMDFPNMFSELEKADFFLPLLDPENSDHNRYITTGVTGSAQLIYGFKKIPIINERFSDFYGFNSENSVLYKNNSDLTDAMISAIKMSALEYDKKIFELNKLVSNIYEKSSNNLQEVLK